MLKSSLIDGNKTNYGDVRIKVSGNVIIDYHPDFDKYSVNGGPVMSGPISNFKDGDVVDLYLKSDHSGAVTLYHFKDVLVEVLDWKLNDSVTSISLHSCSKLVKVPNYLPKSITSMYQMFSGCTNFNQNIANWNVSKVTDMFAMFFNCLKFNQPLNTWNVSKVTDMTMMFFGCISFNQNIDSWNFSKVTKMSYMFYGCSKFNKPLDKWSVSKVTNAYTTLTLI